MPSPEKIKRNEQLIKLRATDPKKWSYGKLGKKFKISRITAYQIYDRDVDKVLAKAIDKS